MTEVKLGATSCNNGYDSRCWVLISPSASSPLPQTGQLAQRPRLITGGFAFLRHGLGFSK